MLDPVLAASIVRGEWSRMVATAMRILSDLAESEDVAQDALLEATRRWPHDGIPTNPAAWLTTVTRNRALNRLRDRNRRGGEPLPLREGSIPSMVNNQPDLDGYGDDRLRLVVLCCHPCLTQEAQVSLTLRLVGGLTTREIANAFVTAEATVAQRISRAKRRLRDHGADFELPAQQELPDRLQAVLEVVYLIFNEGHGPHTDDRRRRILCNEAVALGRELTEIAPASPDVWGLFALMLFQASRFDARLAPNGDLVPLDEQDRARWSPDAIATAERSLAAAHAAVSPHAPLGHFVVEAEIAACHARAETWDDTDWNSIERLYAALVDLTGNPIATLNWAIAHSYSHNPSAAIPILDTLDDRLNDYHLLAATRADFHRRAGHHDQARQLYNQLITTAPSDSQRTFYLRRLHECQGSP